MSDGRERLYPIRPARTSGREYELSRRRFLELVAASAAVGYSSGCSQSASEKILPYTRQPADTTPSVSTAYATSWLIDGYATGLIANTREGRPIKIEGNPDHPASLGATSAFHQAAVLQLYDPDRGNAVLRDAIPAPWSALLDLLQDDYRDFGARVRVLLQPTSSPLTHAVLSEVKQRYPACKVTFHAPLNSQADSEASELLFGRALVPRYDLARSECALMLDADLLATPHDLRHARSFAASRRLQHASDGMSRMYAAEAALSITGSMADHRIARPSSRIASLAVALAAELLPPGSMATTDLKGAAPELDLHELHWLQLLVRDLRERRGRSLIVPGPRQPASVHVLAHALNHVLGNIGHSVSFIDPALDWRGADQALAALVDEMQRGAVDLLLVVGGNPAYDAPADFDWSNAIKHVKRSVYAGAYYNETARGAHWYAPLLHPFESWGDGRAYDGTLSIVQPLIRPLVSGKTETELLTALAQQPAVSDNARMRVRFGEANGEKLAVAMSLAERNAREDPAVTRRWVQLLATGFESGSAFSPHSVAPRSSAIAQAVHAVALSTPEAGMELNFLPSPTLHDGRYANVAWLLELPEPITKLTWDNAALLSRTTAHKLGLVLPESATSGEYPVLEVRLGARVMRLPALVAPGHADDSVSVWLGYGHQGAERLARGVGVDAYRMRTSTALHFAPGVQLTPLGERVELAVTQRERRQHGRELALWTTLREYRAQPDFTHEHKRPLPTLLDRTPGTGLQWAMTIDLSSCTGCSACVVACQAENNVLVVGKEQVRRGREMHWLRIDSYEAESATGTRLVHQPMLCQHCETAPCEYVCPVNATVHSADGLNEMVYNRCIGTRFCSNNCPYKVRRFNWFDWKDEQAANAGRVELQRGYAASDACG